VVIEPSGEVRLGCHLLYTYDFIAKLLKGEGNKSAVDSVRARRKRGRILI
jgi:hypothetical protein